MSRVLEIGDAGHFKAEWPERTTLLWSGPRPPASGSFDGFATPERVARELSAARRGEYALIVLYPPRYSPWHSRYWGRALQRTPLSPWAALSRAFGPGRAARASLPCPIVAVDLDDSCAVPRAALGLLLGCDLYFKRELPIDRWGVFAGVLHPQLPTQRIRMNPRWQEAIERLRPISLPIPTPEGGWTGSSPPEKTSDIFFAGSIRGNSTIRRAGLEELKRLEEHGVHLDLPETGLARGEFLQRLARAHLAWSPSGMGWECYRHHEAPLMGTVALTNYPSIERDAPYIGGQSAIFYDPAPGGLARAALAALKDRARLQKIAEVARAHALAHHTRAAWCQRILAAATLEKSA